jgi:hypothetical protein
MWVAKTEKVRDKTKFLKSNFQNLENFAKNVVLSLTQ